MTHAILILTYGDMDNLHALIDYYRSRCYIFVHIDKKCRVDRHVLEALRGIPQVRGVYQQKSVHWGGNSILDCELFLLKEAMSHCDATYFHILSGEDFPICPLETFLDFFDKGYPLNYLSYVHLPHPLWQDNTYSRFQYFYPYDWGGSVRYPKIVNTVLQLQKKIHFKRRIPDTFPHLYGGSQWMSITRDAVTLLLQYTRKHSAFYRRMFMIFAPDEIYIQTVLCNLLDKKLLAESNQRFIRWKLENGSCPANLSKEHFFYLSTCGKLIARKMKANVSDELKRIVQKYLWQDSACQSMDNGGWNYDGVLRYQFDVTLADKLYACIKTGQYEDGIDFGCGCGYYVAFLRSMGFPITGYDANPYTEDLSRLLLSERDEPCGVANLADDMDEDVQFDFVLCLDVLTYIPEVLQPKALDNLLHICRKCLIISWNEERMTHALRESLKGLSYQSRWHVNQMLSRFFYNDKQPMMRYLIMEKL